ncbi:ABC transporter permease [Arthrobacter sp. PAMC25284]|uniref:ABC transporter permease n=1 Tax=Arthrobacter sp. PAMC25284 TaxID=2861279 RepID=UPI002159B59A|nr:ABC transporter permease [Arthrobacter sp. PAMC25284]
MSHSALDTTAAGGGSRTSSTSSPGVPDVGAGPSFLRVLNSEFIKFRTLFSTLMLLGATMLVLVGFGALSAWGTGTFSEAAATNPRAGAAFADQGAELALGAPTSGVLFAQLILGALGVLLMSSEFTTGMARSTFAAVPRRTPAFVAKLIVVTVTAFVLTLVGVYMAGLVALPILGTYNLPLDLASPQSIKLMLVNSLYVAAVAAIGMALGTLIRNSAGGIMSLVGLFFVAPIAFQLIPGDFFVEARKYLPGNTLDPLTAVEHVPDTLEVWQAALVLGAWVAVPVLLAGILLKKRDV